MKKTIIILGTTLMLAGCGAKIEDDELKEGLTEEETEQVEQGFEEVEGEDVEDVESEDVDSEDGDEEVSNEELGEELGEEEVEEGYEGSD